MIFRWPSNDAWNPREWIAKRMNMRQRNSYWEDDELMAKVKKFADPVIERNDGRATRQRLYRTTCRRSFEQNVKVDQKGVRSEKESHILVWMICIYIYIYPYGVGRRIRNGVYHLCILTRRCPPFSILSII